MWYSNLINPLNTEYIGTCARDTAGTQPTMVDFHFFFGFQKCLDSGYISGILVVWIWFAASCCLQMNFYIIGTKKLSVDSHCFFNGTWSEFRYVVDFGAFEIQDFQSSLCGRRNRIGECVWRTRQQSLGWFWVNPYMHEVLRPQGDTIEYWW